MIFLLFGIDSVVGSVERGETVKKTGIESNPIEIRVGLNISTSITVVCGISITRRQR